MIIPGVHRPITYKLERSLKRSTEKGKKGAGKKNFIDLDLLSSRFTFIMPFTANRKDFRVTFQLRFAS